jgi:hypothetical protein
MTDWNAIRADYEQGQLSQSALAKKHGISRKAISNHARGEHWTSPTVTGHTSQVTPATPPPPLANVTPFPLPADAHSIARIGLHQLALHLQSETLLEIKDHKSLSDALSQYIKVLATAPETDATQDGLLIPFDRLSARTRMEIRRLLAEDESMLHKNAEVS